MFEKTKYALKSEAIKLSFIKLADKEKEELFEVVANAVSFWSTLLYNYNLSQENEVFNVKK